MECYANLLEVTFAAAYGMAHGKRAWRESMRCDLLGNWRDETTRLETRCTLISSQ